VKNEPPTETKEAIMTSTFKFDHLVTSTEHFDRKGKVKDRFTLDAMPYEGVPDIVRVVVRRKLGDYGPALVMLKVCVDCTNGTPDPRGQYEEAHAMTSDEYIGYFEWMILPPLAVGDVDQTVTISLLASGRVTHMGESRENIVMPTAWSKLAEVVITIHKVFV
jgi:hypothetical protein